jgi:hypothetical protein
MTRHGLGLKSPALARAPWRPSPTRWTRILPVGFVHPREPTLAR